MAPTYNGQLPLGKVVLGLLIARTVATPSLIAQLVGERFDFAGYSPSAAYKVLRRLAKQNLAVLVYEDPNEEHALDRYEATQDGETDFVEWLHATTMAPLVLREAVYGRIELAGPDDLPWIARGISKEEEVCRREFRACRKALETFEVGIASARDWRLEARAAVMADKGLVWYARLGRLRRLRRSLERIHAKHVAAQDTAGDSGG